MKEVLYKINFEKYHNIGHNDSTTIEDYDARNNTSFFPPTIKHPLFKFNLEDKTEEEYIKNFGNKLYSVKKEYAMLVVERCEDKVSMKFFSGYKHRLVGKSWFNISKSVTFITANLKTGDVYHGRLSEYQKKKKCRKTLCRNYFSGDPLKNFINVGNSYLYYYDNDGNKEYMNNMSDAVSVFLNEIDQNKYDDKYNKFERLFKFYLDKRGVKYPNNFITYMPSWTGIELKKILKKQGNRMVDTIMVFNKLEGKQIKKALHNCKFLNISIYRLAIKLFGEDWLNQDYKLTLACLNSEIVGFSSVPNSFKTLTSVEELRRVFQLFKTSVLTEDINIYTFIDHIRFYVDLRLFGENVKWFSNGDDDEFMRKEHLEWTEKLEHYRNGTYSRVYPKYMYDMVSEVITDENNDYYPILLDSTSNYNEESSYQSNCVKSYVDRSTSIIVSLRKNMIERATLEYRMFNNEYTINAVRVQSLGRFNEKLSDEWDNVLNKLDEKMLSIVNDERFETFKLIKECKNGVKLTSDSYWDDSGVLKWSYKEINGRQENVELFNNFDYNYF
jgi:hypothetical protein